MFKKVAPFIMVFVATLSTPLSSTAFAEEEKKEEQKSIYCDDGSLCVPEGEPEPECD